MRADNYYPGFKRQMRWGQDDLGIGYGNTKGDIWYVDGDKSTGGAGQSWDDAFPTITAANDAMSDDDVCFIAPGEYTEVDGVTITNDNVKFIGASGGSGTALTHTLMAPFDGELDGDLNPVTPGSSDGFILSGDNIEIAHLGFQGGAGYWMIDCDEDTDSTSNWVHDCYFYAHAQGSAYGVRMGRRDGDSGNAVSMVVEDCFFFKCGTTAINLDASRGQVKRNTFLLMHTASAGGGIVCPQSGSQRNSNEIVDNIFIGYGSPCDAKGINFSGANVPTVGTMWVDGNQFINFASATAACNRLATYGGRNWLGDQFLTDANPPVATTVS